MEQPGRLWGRVKAMPLQKQEAGQQKFIGFLGEKL
jgi:hypothetical protein